MGLPCLYKCPSVRSVSSLGRRLSGTRTLTLLRGQVRRNTAHAKHARTTNHSLLSFLSLSVCYGLCFRGDVPQRVGRLVVRVADGGRYRVSLSDSPFTTRAVRWEFCLGSAPATAGSVEVQVALVKGRRSPRALPKSRLLHQPPPAVSVAEPG